MNMYASKTHESLTTHAAAKLCGTCEAEFQEDGAYSETEHRDHHQAPQHNEPNPILVAFRVALSKGATLNDLYEDMTGYQISYPGVDDVQEAWDAAAEAGTLDELNAHAFEILSRVYYAAEHAPVNWFTQGVYPSCSCGYAPRDNMELNHHWRGFGVRWVDDHGRLVKKALK